MSKIWMGIGILIVLVGGFFLFSGNSGATGNIIDSGDAIKIPLSEISDQATFYSEGKINYFVVKARDGSIKTAFDACDVCGGSKGYTQEGGDMICNNCGRHFKISQLGEQNIYGGGCWPSHLESNIRGEYLVISKSDIEAGGYSF